MTTAPTVTPGAPPALTIPRGAALYIGALLGPGLLLIPGLASSIAGPAAILAWIGLLGVSALFAIVFTALARRFPSGGGVATYTAAGLGPRAGNAAAWCFLIGVVAGAPAVCLVCGAYVTALTGGGLLVGTAVAAAVLIVVLLLGLRGARTTTTIQLVLVAVLILVVAVAVIGSAGSARTSNWTPFAPHGWTAVGRAAAVAIFAFVGWEAIAPLTPRFRDPARQLPRVITIAFVTTAVVYLGLAAAPTAVLGAGAAGNAPLAGLLQVALGPAGHAVAAVVAVVLTVGTANAYLSGAVAMAQSLTRSPESGRRFYLVVAAAGLVVLGLHALRVVDTTELVALPTTLFVVVYLGAMAAATIVLRGWARVAAVPALIAVMVLLAFSGAPLAVAAAVALIAAIWAGPNRSRHQNDLAGAPPVQQRPVGGNDLAEGERRADEDLQPAGLRLARELEAGRVANLGAGVRARATTQHLDAGGATSGEGGDRGDAIAIADQLETGIDRLIGPGRIERDIDPVAC